MIKVTDVGFTIGKTPLLENISFEAQQGEFVAIIGANGAGKSTLLKLLSKETTPSSGCIHLKNRSLESYSFSELATFRSVLSQQTSLAMSFTVKEIVLMGRYPHFKNRPSWKDMEIVHAVMKENGIRHLAERDYNTLSGGEQQRVQLARVIAQIYDAEVGYLFLDEPTNGLDLLYQQQTLQIARKMANRGFTVICILHDINFASTYADQLLMLKNGRKVAFGAPKEVVTCATIHEVFNVPVQMMSCEGQQCPLVIPYGVPV